MMTAIEENNCLSNAEKHDQRLHLLKQQVKAIMEESVTKKFIHEESPHLLRLCGTVEKCLLEGLKNSAVFLRQNKIATLYTKISKNVSGLNELVNRIETELRKIERQSFLKENHVLINGQLTINGSRKYLWIRMAITTKILNNIVDYLVRNHKKFYENTSIMADPVRGKILASLLVGACALEYTKVKTHDHYWSDPPAYELLQRHNLHSRGCLYSPSKRPTLQFSSFRHSSSSDFLDHESEFRNYVESLHQNSRISLLYGKNNVTVQPDQIGPIPGYLSLHQEGCRLLIKWTPNQLMSGADFKTKQFFKDNVILHHNVINKPKTINGAEEDSLKHSRKLHHSVSSMKHKKRSCYWDFAISVDVYKIVYLHCHHIRDNDGVLVLVGQDGVHWPPIRFPPGGHLLTFLSCLETALLPNGYLDPPLWLEEGKGKVFPLIHRKNISQSSSTCKALLEESTDFVFYVCTKDDADLQLDSASLANDAETPEFNLMQSISTLPLHLKKYRRRRERSLVDLPRTDPPFRSISLFQRSLSESPYKNTDVTKRPSSISDNASRRGSSAGSNCSDKSESKCSTGRHETIDEYLPNLDSYAWNRSDSKRYYPATTVTASLNDYSGSSLKTLCDSMRRQIISRAFYGWLAHCRHLSIVRKYLTHLVHKQPSLAYVPTDASGGVTDEVWQNLFQNGRITDYQELCRYVYYGGISCKRLRPLIWLYLLGFYKPDSDESDRRRIDEEARNRFRKIRILDEDIKAKYSNKSSLPNDELVTSSNNISSSSGVDFNSKGFQFRKQASYLSDVFTSENEMAMTVEEDENVKEKTMLFKYASLQNEESSSEISENYTNDKLYFERNSDNGKECNLSAIEVASTVSSHGDPPDYAGLNLEILEKARASSFDSESSDIISVNLTQIKKDVFRCDRNHEYFAQEENLQKLDNIMSCYVWERPDPGYVQGMCDLAAPLLLLLDDESIVYSCFVKLMDMIPFQKGNEMDKRLANLRSLTQVLDYELYEYLHKASDSAHFFFCYKWFLLEFKRELSYNEDLFAVWECSWAARSCATNDFGLFFASAILQKYRDIILENELDFSGIVRFFNELAERHDANLLLEMSRKLVADIQQTIQK